MGKNKGSWRKFFCCAGPPETQSTTCLNINVSESDSFKPLSEPDASEPGPEQDQEEEDEGLYVETEVQTSKVDIPEGNRWRWSRLHREVEQQTSTVSLPIAEAESSSEADVQVQTSFSSIPREVEAQAQTSFLSLRCSTPFQTEARAQTSFAELSRVRDVEAQVQASLSSLLGEREAQVQTSLSSLPREREAQIQTSLPSLSGEREAQVQTSLSSLPREREVQIQMSLPSLSREREAQVQTSLFSLPKGKEAQVQTSLFSLPKGKEAQVQTSLLSLSEERDAQIQTSLSSLYGGKEAHVQTSFASLPERTSSSSLGAYGQGPSSYVELLEKISSFPIFVDTQMQTSKSNISTPSETDIQVQTSFSDYMSEKEDESSIGTEPQSKISPQSSVSTLYPLYVDTEVQTLPVEIPPGNDWRSARLQAEAQVQTSFTSLLEEPGDNIEVQYSKPELDREGEVARELHVPFFIEEKSLTPELIETAIQTSDTLIREWDKWRSLQPPQVIAQVQTSTIELLKKLSLLSRIECMEPASRTELLKKSSSLSVAEFTPETSGHEIMRKASSWSDTGSQGQWSNNELLKMRPSSAQVLVSSGHDLTASSSKRKSQLQTSDLELMKKLSSLSHMEPQEKISEIFSKCSALSLNEGGDENQEETTEIKEHHIAPELMEDQIRKWYHELPEVQTSDSQALDQKEWLWSAMVDSGVQTSFVEIPFGNRWRESRLQAEAEVQTVERKLPVEEIQICPQAENNIGAQTSLLEIWQARNLAESQMQTSYLDVVKDVQSPPPFLVKSPAQTSFLDFWRAKEQTDAQMQTSLEKFQVIRCSPTPTEPIDRVVETSFIDIWRAKTLDDRQQQTSLDESEEPEGVSSPPFQTDLDIQTSLAALWRNNEVTDSQVQTSLSELLESKEELPLVLQNDAQVQTTNSEMSVGDSWRRPHSHVDIQQQTSLELEDELEDSPPPSQMDIQVQTSLLDVWKAKELHNAQMQTSWTDLSESAKASSLTLQCESPQPESPPLIQVDTQAQTSSLDIWKGKEINDAEVQTSLSYLLQGAEELPLQPEGESPGQPAMPGLADVPDESLPLSQIDSKEQILPDMQKEVPESLSQSETKVQTEQFSLTNLPDATDVSPVPSTSAMSPVPSVSAVSPVPSASAMSPVPSASAMSPVPSVSAMSPVPSTSAMSPVPSGSAVSPVPSGSAMSPVPSASAMSPGPSAPAMSPVPSASAVSPVTSAASLSPVPSTSSISPAPSAASAAVFSSPSAAEVSPVPSGTIMSPITPRTAASPIPSRRPPSLPSIITVSPVPSRTASPMRPSTPASLYSHVVSATPEENSTPVEKSLLELWSTREEAELQIQTAKLGMSFEEDWILFQKIIGNQEKIEDVKPSEKKKMDQVSKAKSKAPVFTEAQVQTSYVDIPRGKKWRSSRLCTEAQVQTSFHDFHGKERTSTLHDHIAPRRVQKGPKRTSPVSVHLHVKMSPKRRTSNEIK